MSETISREVGYLTKSGQKKIKVFFVCKECGKERQRVFLSKNSIKFKELLENPVCSFCKISIHHKIMYKEHPEIKEKITKGFKEYNASGKHSAKMKNYWQSDRSKNQREKRRTEEARQKNSEAVKNAYKNDPSIVERQKESYRKYWGNLSEEEKNEKRASWSKAQNRPEVIQKHRDYMKGAWKNGKFENSFNTPEYKEKVRLNGLRRWQDPDFVKKVTKKYSFIFNNETLKFDSKAEAAYYYYELLQNNNKLLREPASFNYDVNGEEHVYIPDFKDVSKNVFVEIKGDMFFNKNGDYGTPWKKGLTEEQLEKRKLVETAKWDLMQELENKKELLLIKSSSLNVQLNFLNDCLGKGIIQSL